MKFTIIKSSEFTDTWLPAMFLKDDKPKEEINILHTIEEIEELEKDIIKSLKEFKEIIKNIY